MCIIMLQHLRSIIHFQRYSCLNIRHAHPWVYIGVCVHAEWGYQINLNNLYRCVKQAKRVWLLVSIWVFSTIQVEDKADVAPESSDDDVGSDAEVAPESSDDDDVGSDTGEAMETQTVTTNNNTEVEVISETETPKRYNEGLWRSFCLWSMLLIIEFKNSKLALDFSSPKN